MSERQPGWRASTGVEKTRRLWIATPPKARAVELFARSHEASQKTEDALLLA